MSPPSDRRRAERPASIIQLLDEALARRAALLADPQTNVGRVFNGAADGVDGLVIEKLGDVLVAQLYEGRLAVPEDVARDLCAEAARRLGARAVYRKVFPKDRTVASARLERLHSDPSPWIGVPAEPELAVRENGVVFLVRPYDGYATGLFLDHRLQRARVRELASGRRVLNAFAYTCGFSVVAALGGAAATVNVDASKKYLEWGKRNVTANGIAHDNHRFICSDVFDYYRRAKRQGQRFDYIILDPPTFGRCKKPRTTFSLPDDLERLVAGAMELLGPNGYLQLSVNHAGTTLGRLEQLVSGTAQAQGRSCDWMVGPAPPEDFAGDSQPAKLVLARMG